MSVHQSQAWSDEPRRRDRRQEKRQAEEQPPPRPDTDPSLAAVDLVELDAAYKRAAAAGRDDTAARDRAVAAAMASTAQRRKAGPPGAPTPRQRAVAAQRWEQNREYVESRREDAPRRD